MPSFYSKNPNDKSFLQNATQDWASQYDAELDAIKQTGKAPKRNLWDDVKGLYKETKVDAAEALNLDLIRDSYFDPDEARQNALKNERQNALKQYQLNQTRASQGKEPLPFYSTETWKAVRENGKYK